LSVTWTAIAKKYLPEDEREGFLAEIEKAQWVPLKGNHPFSPGLALQEIGIDVWHEIGLPLPDEVTYSQEWVVREDDYHRGEYIPDFMINGTIIGIRSKCHKVALYFLDLNDIVPVALVFED
jgi:hypothetical protein